MMLVVFFSSYMATLGCPALCVKILLWHQNSLAIADITVIVQASGVGLQQATHLAVSGM